MKLTPKLRWLYEKKTMAKMFKNIMGINLSLRDICGNDAMVYHTASNVMYLNICPKIIDDLNESKARVARFGLFVHEMVHVQYTDYEYALRLATKSAPYQAAFYLIFDACEDITINELTETVVGGNLLDAFRYSNKLIKKHMPPINECGDGFYQFLAAIKYFALGSPKGKFTDKQAKDIFDKCLINLDKILNEGDPEVRVNLIYEIFEASRDLWINKIDELKAVVTGFENAVVCVEKVRKDFKNGSFAFGSARPGRGIGDIAEDYIPGNSRMTEFVEKDDEEDELSSLPSGAAISSTTSTGTSTSIGSSSSGASGGSPGGGASDDNDEVTWTYDKDAEVIFNDSEDYEAEDVEIEDEVVNTFDKLIEAELSLDGVIKASPEREIPDIPSVIKAYKQKSYKLENQNLYGKVENPADAIEYYDKVISEYEAPIKKTVDTLSGLFAEDRTEKEYRSSGSISLKKMHSGKVSTRLFTKKAEPESREDLAIMLLVDESGSMYGNRIERAKAAIAALSEVCSRLNIPFYVAGHTADENGFDCNMRHYKHWDDSTKIAKCACTGINARSNNFDGYAIRVASGILGSRHEAHKILFSISDGQPACSVYHGLSGLADTKDAISSARDAGQNVIGISIGADRDVHKELYGEDCVDIVKLDEMFTGITKKLANMVKGW